MKQLIELLVFIIIMVLASVSPASALTIDITLSGNPPPRSVDLNTYLYDPTIGSLRSGSPFTLVGFDGDGIGYGDDIGYGAGTGNDDLLAFSFEFTPFYLITSATLTLGLEPTNSLISTDQLSFADNWTQPNQGYGNDILRTLSVGTYYDVAFDLSNMDVYQTAYFHDLRNFLLDGDFDVAYADDAIIDYARLTISGTPVPEPATMLLFSIGLVWMAGMRLKRKKK